MHPFAILVGLFFSLSVLASQTPAPGWYAGAPGVWPGFSTPSEACTWFIGNKCCTDWIFTHVSTHLPGTDRDFGPRGYFCYGIWTRNPQKPSAISTAEYVGPLEDILGKDETYYNNNAPIPDELKERIRRTMRRFYGDQFNQWDINPKMLRVFQKWILRVAEVCHAFKFIPEPVTSPILSAHALVEYFVQYGKKIVEESESEANYSCMLTAAAAMKTEFWEAGNL